MSDTLPRRKRVARKLSPKSNRGKIIDSTVFTMGDRIGTLAITWIVSIIMANYLGSSGFGTLAYSTAFVSLFAAVVSAGLSGIVVKDLVKKPTEQNEILGTVFVIRAAAALISFAIAAFVALGTNIGPSGADALTLVIAFGMCGKATEVIDFWFQSKTQLRYVAIANFSGTIIGAAAKLIFVAIGAPLVFFAWAIVIETAFTSLLMFITFKQRGGTFNKWKYQSARAGAYLKRTWPLVISGAANAINLKMDQVLLGALASSSAVGTYAVAARLSEVWYFVPTAIAGAIFPSLIRSKAKGEEEYRKMLRLLYGTFAWGAIGVAAIVSLVAHPLIQTLYDRDYWSAADVLVIHVWTAPFLFMSVIFSKWLITEELLIMSLVRHGFAAILNIVLNIILIPHHGPVGSAVATLVSYAAATYLACFLRPKTWPVAMDMTRALFLSPFELGIWGFKKLRNRTAA